MMPADMRYEIKEGFAFVFVLDTLLPEAAIGYSNTGWPHH
jgi:hypothetical protein